MYYLCTVFSILYGKIYFWTILPYRTVEYKICSSVFLKITKKINYMPEFMYKQTTTNFILLGIVVIAVAIAGYYCYSKHNNDTALEAASELEA